ncbi:MAG: hypothetical protein LBL23_06340 [Coriobacteriales bacterium]|jgi:hypothetical protein|nr:hypothetical protein [Coriobacteriales bacterium]
MDDERREALRRDLQPEYRGSNIEKVYLAYADSIPMWETAALPPETVIMEMSWLLARESSRSRKLEAENSYLRERLAATG